MIGKIKAISGHRFVRSVATLQSGYVLLSAIQALAGIALARILGPDSFGLFSLAMSMASLSSALVGIGIQDSGATLISEAYARRDRQAILNAAGFVLRVMSVIAILVIVACIIMPAVAGKIYAQREIGVLASMILLASLFSSTLFSLAWMFYQVINKTREMMVLSITDQGLRYGLSVTLAFAGFGAAGASLGHLAGAIIIFLLSFIFLWRIHKQDSMFPNLPELWERTRGVRLSEHLKFGAGIAVDRNIAMLFSILPVFLAGIYVSASEVAYFKSAMAYSTLALSLLGPVSVLLHVEFPKNKVEDIARLRRNFIKVSLYSLGLSLILTVGATLVAPWAVRILFGTEYGPSVKYVYGLFAFGALYGIGVGLGPMWRALNLVRVSILINLITLVLTVPAGIFGMSIFGVWGGIAMATAMYVLSHFTSFIYLSSRLKSMATEAVSV